MKSPYIIAASLLAVAINTFAPQSFGQMATTEPANTAEYRGDLGHSGHASTTMSPVLSVLWQNTFSGITKTYSSPALVNGVLYFGASGHVYAVNAKDGTLKWQYPSDGTSAAGNFNDSPAIDNGKVLIGSDSNSLYALDSETGSLLWQQPTGGPVDDSPVFDNGDVFFGGNDDYLYGFNESNQKPVWGGQFRTSGPVFTAPTISDGIICFADADSNIYGVSESSGRFLWTYRPSNGVAVGSPVCSDGLLIFASTSSVFSLSLRSGEIRSGVQLPSIITSPPTVNDNTVYVSTADQTVYALSTHGMTLWHTRLPDVVTVPMTVTDNYLYAITRHGVVYGLDSQTGHPIWSYALQTGIIQPGDNTSMTRQTEPKATVTAAPLASNGVLYILSNDGTLTALCGAASDNVSPQVLAAFPQAGTTIAGANVPFHAFVSDTGSGIDPKTVSLTVDGASVPVFYDPSYSEVSVQYNMHNTGSITMDRIILPTLMDGPHTSVLKIADWRGNVETKTWSFTVDNTLNPPGSSAPAAVVPGGTFGSQPGSDLSASSDLQPAFGFNQNGAQAGATGGGASSSGGGGIAGTSENPNRGPIAPPTGYPGAGPGTGGTGGGGGGGGTGGGGSVPPPPPI